MTATTKTQAAHVVAMNNRGRFTFNRTFLAALSSGKGHHDVAKLSAFLVAAKVATAKSIQAMAKAGKLTKEVLNEVAIGVVALTPAAELPKNLNLSK